MHGRILLLKSYPLCYLLRRKRKFIISSKCAAMAVFGQVCHDLGPSFPGGGVAGQVEADTEEERRKARRLLSLLKVVPQSGFPVGWNRCFNG